jgi:dihydrolipoamide dehydrogenase
MKTLTTDVAIIGAGTAGLSAYRAVKAQGCSALLIEGGVHGTTCARIGCMPSKLLIAAAEAAHGAQHTAPFGVHVDGAVRIDGKEVMRRVRDERDRFVGFVISDVEAMPAADKLSGYARFISDNHLRVDEHTDVHAERVVIATGSSPVVPDIYKTLGDRVVVNDDVFYWQDLPKRVVVIGAGVIGLEIGQALSRLGVAVTIVNRSESLAGLSDPEVKVSARDAFCRELDLKLAYTVETVQRLDDAVKVCIRNEQGDSHELLADVVLLAAGRRPNVDKLELGSTSAKLDDKGMPIFDPDTLQVGSSSIFIAGDVNGVLPLLHEAADDGRIAGRNAALFSDVQPGKRRAPLSIVFTDPQIAMVGLHFKQLPKDGVAIGEVDFSNQGRSRIILKNQGKLRIYAAKQDGRFLGAEMAGPAMEHIAHLLAWAHQMELSINDMLAMPFYHPVIEEGLRTALRKTKAAL